MQRLLSPDHAVLARSPTWLSASTWAPTNLRTSAGAWSAQQLREDSSRRSQASAQRDLAVLRSGKGQGLVAVQEPGTAEAQPFHSSQVSITSDQGTGANLPEAYFSRLCIRDFALVDHQILELQPGLNVVTGESGAGKSVLMSALGQVLGAAVPPGCVRQPAEVAVITGTVSFGTEHAKAAMAPLLQGVGLPPRVVQEACGPTGQLVLKRELYSQGADGGVRSRCYVNGAAVSLRSMRELGEALVDVNGQHAAQRLSDPAMQMRLLDRIAGTGHLATHFGRLLRKLQGIRAELAALQAFNSQKQRDSMQALVDEVVANGLQPGEEVQLRQALQAMAARQGSAERCSLVRGAIQGDGSGGGLTEGLRDVEFHLAAVQASETARAEAGEDAEEFEEEEGAVQLLEEAMEKLQDARDALAEVEAKVAQYTRTFRFSQLEYDELMRRRKQVLRLLKRHDCSTSEDLLDKAAEAEAGLDKWFAMEGQTAKQQALLVELQEKLAAVGVQLGGRRRAAAGKLRAAVESCLADLAMAGSRFDVRIGWQPSAQASEGIAVPASAVAALNESSAHPSGAFHPTPSGFDTTEFLLAAGPAEPLRPLASVASGGESSRIMLALKAAPAFAAGGLREASGEAAGQLASEEAQGPALGASRGGTDAGVLMLDGQHPGDAPVLFNLGAADGSGEFDLPLSSDEDSALELEGLSSQIMILDELDSGVGGRLGSAVGQLLRNMVVQGPQLSSPTASQILCVSHLPQVAAHAQHHVVVRKQLDPSGRVLTRFTPLQSQKEREGEVAAMLGLGLPQAQMLMHAAQPS
ncbi:hypothetical protein WJX73_001384 [Symbiochloris irregularis]|uniref:DNA repair protein RecN n=1 Tax=Symbiochloris irregularis TaxID=706552 RepID=A0AAW1NT73_9CHLO